RHHLMVGYEPEEFFEKVMDPAGVAKVITPALQQYLYRDRELVRVPWESVAEVVQKYPDRVAGMYGIDPYSGMKGVREFELAVKEYGFVGGHVHPFGFDTPINDAKFYPFYAKAAELGVPVEFQTGHSAEFMPSKHGHPLLLDDVAIYFPELKLIGAHQAWPWCEVMIAMAWKHPNVYVAMSGHAPKYWDKSLVHFLNSRGMGKVLWGTDYPLIQHEESLGQIEELGLKPEAKELLLHGAAKALFGWD
ncbi:MAG TPA: amidohydrolase family protein, partial [Acidimicrobiia bacterium]|nr:amidohydrolase family protein [Acidimicrobiia bacterium]